MRKLNGFWPLCLLTAFMLGPPAHAETSVQRGAYLVNSIAACGSCHTERGPAGPAGKPVEKRLAGGLQMSSPAFTVYSPNITPDPMTGIGRWTPAQIVTAIREGRRPDGSVIGPPMPVVAYRHMADADANAIVAYLRSVPPVRNTVPPSHYRVPLPKSYGPPVTHIAAVSPRNRLAYGKYLATIGHCLECHTPMGPDGRRAYRTQLGAGSQVFEGAWGTSVAADITPRGLRRFSDSQLTSIITTGTLPDGTKLKPPMPFAYYARMKPTDLDALIFFLRALPAR